MSASCDSVVELRVHGVSGTPPESLLARPLVTQVAGDAVAGFYRPRLREERYDDVPSPGSAPLTRSAPLLEGYNWGGLTSGSPGRAFWLLLVPFTLVNVAPRARPDDSTSPHAHLTRWATWFLSRVLGLCLTLLLTLTTAGIVLDLVWWQCRQGDGECPGAPGLVNRALDDWSAGTTLVTLALLPALLLVTLWAISYGTLGRYEDVPDHRAFLPDDERRAIEVPLGSSWMWNNREIVTRLRSLHLQSGAALIVWTVASAADQEGTLAAVAGKWVPSVVLGYALVVLALPGVSSREPWSWSTRWLKILIWLILSVAVATQVLSLWGRDDIGQRFRIVRQKPRGLPGFEHGILWLIIATAVITGLLVIVLIISKVRQGPTLSVAGRPAENALHPGLRGFTAAYLAVLGVLLAAALSAAAYSYAGTWLTSGLSRPGPGAVATGLEHFTLPDTFRAATIAIAWSVVVLVLTLAVCGSAVVVRSLGIYVRPPGAFDADYPLADLTQKSRLRAIRRAMYFGTLVETIPAVVAWLVVAGAVISGILGTVLIYGTMTYGGCDHDSLLCAMRGTAPKWSWADCWNNPQCWIGPEVQGWGAFAALWSLIGVVGLTALAFRVPATRRIVGIVWDVASFWPRVAHPLAAPCYAERTVPDLVTRLRFHVREGRKVVLAAHSQGTVLSAAVLLRVVADRDAPPGDPTSALEPDPRGNVALLTFGCVLRRLYGRFFPYYFGPRRIEELTETITLGDRTPWVNLWRYTDYLGGQVMSGPPQVVASVVGVAGLQPALKRHDMGPLEWHSPDPPSFARPSGDTTYASPLRHSEYWTDPSGVFQVAVSGLIECLDGLHIDPGCSGEKTAAPSQPRRSTARDPAVDMQSFSEGGDLPAN